MTKTKEHDLNSSKATDAAENACVVAHPELEGAERISKARTLWRSQQWKTAQAAFIAALLAIGTLELVARFVVAMGRPLDGPSASFDAKYNLAKVPNRPGRPSLLFIGGSFTSDGIYSELLTARLAQKGYDLDVRNLASEASSCLEHLCLLKTAVDHGAKPALVVYDLRPISFNFLFAHNPELSGVHTFLRSHAGHRFATTGHNPIKVIGDWFTDSFYLVKYRAFLKSVIMNWHNYAFNPGKLPRECVEGQMTPPTSAQGWSPAFTIAERDSFPDRVPLNRQADRWATFVLSSDTIKPVQDYCEQNHIPLLFAWLPEHESSNVVYHTFNMSQEDFSKYFAKLPKAQQQEGFLDLHDVQKDPVYYFNKDHVNAAGAIPLTEQIADRLTSEPFKTWLEVGRRGNK